LFHLIGRIADRLADRRRQALAARAGLEIRRQRIALRDLDLFGCDAEMLGDELRCDRVKPRAGIGRAEKERELAFGAHAELDGRAAEIAGRMLVDRDAAADTLRLGLVPAEGFRAGIDGLAAAQMPPLSAERRRIALFDGVA